MFFKTSAVMRAHDECLIKKGPRGPNWKTYQVIKKLLAFIYVIQILFLYSLNALSFTIFYSIGSI
jgi:hypothetical protein